MSAATDPIREAFFRRTLERDFKTILQRQQAIAEERIYREGNRRQTGQLRSFFSSREMEMTGTDPVSVRINYPIQIRFLDMRKNGNHRIYNRQLWGKLYRETLPELRWGFVKGVREDVEDIIRESMEAGEGIYEEMKGIVKGMFDE